MEYETEYPLDLRLIEKTIKSIEDESDYVDIRVTNSLNNVIVMKEGKLQDIRSGNELGGSVRVLKNGAWGFSFTNHLDELEEAARSALKLAKNLKSDVELVETTPTRDHVKNKAKIRLSDVALDEKKEVITEAEKAARLDGIVSTTVNYVDGDNVNYFMNSEGTNLEVEESRVAMFLNAVASSDGVIQFGHKSIGGAAGFETIKNEDLEKFGRTPAEKALGLLKAETPPSGKFPVIMDPELTGVFIHEALGHASEADLILQNDSILKDRMNSQIGSPLVTVIDDASMDAFGYYPYDAEGVKTRKNILVQNGMLVSLLSSRETASKLDIQSSGNARSSVTDQPIVRMSNTYLKPGELSFDEIIEDMSNGIYLRGSRGGQVDTGKGIFQFNAAESFIIKNGEISTPLRDVSLSGRTLDMLRKVDALGSDFKMSVGFCGKDGQTAPVGDGGPHVRVTEATVGGAT